MEESHALAFVCLQVSTFVRIILLADYLMKFVINHLS